MIPDEAVEAAARKMFSKWDDLPESSKEHLYPDVRAILEAAAPRMLDTGAMSEERKVPIHRTSDWRMVGDGEVTVSTVEDLEALCVKYGNPLILSIGEDGKLSSIEVYDAYTE